MEIIRVLSFTPVLTSRSHDKDLANATPMTTTSVSGVWMTTSLKSELMWLACNNIRVSASSCVQFNSSIQVSSLIHQHSAPVVTYKIFIPGIDFFFHSLTRNLTNSVLLLPSPKKECHWRMTLLGTIFLNEMVLEHRRFLSTFLIDSSKYTSKTISILLDSRQDDIATSKILSANWLNVRPVVLIFRTNAIPSMILAEDFGIWSTKTVPFSSAASKSDLFVFIIIPISSAKAYGTVPKGYLNISFSSTVLDCEIRAILPNIALWAENCTSLPLMLTFTFFVIVVNVPSFNFFIGS